MHAIHSQNQFDCTTFVLNVGCHITFVLDLIKNIIKIRIVTNSKVTISAIHCKRNSRQYFGSSEPSGNPEMSALKFVELQYIFQVL